MDVIKATKYLFCTLLIININPSPLFLGKSIEKTDVFLKYSIFLLITSIWILNKG